MYPQSNTLFFKSNVIKQNKYEQKKTQPKSIFKFDGMIHFHNFIWLKIPPKSNLQIMEYV